ncbi:MAG: AI-2E family transporter [Actinomyces sp.]|nr:AI-2E family transporter [Actinomyces sp.]
MNPAQKLRTTRLDALARAGRTSWAVLGLVALVLMGAAVASTLSGILIPLVVAALFGTVLQPLTQRLQRLGMPPALGAALGLLLTLATVCGLVAVLVWGFLAQIPQISEQLAAGWVKLESWASSQHLEVDVLERFRAALADAAPEAGMGVLSFLTRTAYGLVSLRAGSFFAMFFLFFVLKDGHLFPGWLAGVTGQDPAVVRRVDAHVRSSLYGYFRGTALTAVLTAPIFAVPLVVLRIPLVVPIMVVYFFLSLIPFAGAWITGVFAVLIAFGAGGPGAALIVAASLLVSNGTIQSAVSSWALGSSLRLHPVLVLLATLVGGAWAGILGMVLGAPLLAAVRTSLAALRAPDAVEVANGAGAGAGAGRALDQE